MTYPAAHTVSRDSSSDRCESLRTDGRFARAAVTSFFQRTEHFGVRARSAFKHDSHPEFRVYDGHRHSDSEKWDGTLSLCSNPHSHCRPVVHDPERSDVLGSSRCTRLEQFRGELQEERRGKITGLVGIEGFG